MRDQAATLALVLNSIHVETAPRQTEGSGLENGDGRNVCRIARRLESEKGTILRGETFVARPCHRPPL